MPPKDIPTILAVDDHSVLREGLTTMIGTQKDRALIAAAETGKQAIALFGSEASPNLWRRHAVQ